LGSKFEPGASGFSVVLIGKDGGEKRSREMGSDPGRC